MKLYKLGLTAVVLSLVIGGSIPNISYATDKTMQTLGAVTYDVISPLWNNIAGISAEISSEDNTVYPEVFVKAQSPSLSISGTMYLERYTSGKWTTVASWSIKGTGDASASKSYNGTSGIKYRTRVTVTVNGEKAEATSISLVL